MKDLKQLFDTLEAIGKKMDRKQLITDEEILLCATQPETREELYTMLYEGGMVEKFPQQYFTLEKAAESNLISWLSHPNELNAYPNDIAYIKRVTIKDEEEDEALYYEVFRFKTNEPHWAAKNGWMIGVVGVYIKESEPYDFPEATFSRLKKETEITPEEEAAWVHENVYLPLLDEHVEEEDE